MEGHELLRTLLQSHLDLRGMSEPVGAVRGADGVERTHRRADTTRSLTTVLGEVVVRRSRYGGRSAQSLHPVDADRNLPVDKHSLHIGRRVALTAARLSFDATMESINHTTGALVPKRQVGQLVQRAAQDFEAWYDHIELAVSPRDTGSVLALSLRQCLHLKLVQ